MMEKHIKLITVREAIREIIGSLLRPDCIGQLSFYHLYFVFTLTLHKQHGFKWSPSFEINGGWELKKGSISVIYV